MRCRSCRDRFRAFHADRSGHDCGGGYASGTSQRVSASLDAERAVLKAAGCGLLGGLDGVDVSQEPLDQVRLYSATGDRAESFWRVQDLEQIEGFAGAVAAPTGIGRFCSGRFDTKTLSMLLGRIFGVE